MMQPLATVALTLVPSVALAWQAPPLGVSGNEAERPLHFLADEQGALWIRLKRANLGIQRT